ncbi:MAG TPA: HAMP domain-containing sensor histidine kinase [Sulfurimonas sp.]|uniref:sensor histidine kinase n=1 Tax=Sulfurimonas sp. TaxID=2022749 RepID=UPI002CF5FF04|nr:HAMP domain-containing sensor histidine kinase [Sulfurimonas sp.]HUH43384.1 HAMP domain-containing sensor histidine kinase [Sulfurimonas sp.]
MYSSERKSIFYVLGLYLTSTLLLIATLFGSYYIYKQDELMHFEEDALKEYSSKLLEKLFYVHENSDTRYEYPRFEEFRSAIYDIDKNLIFSTLDVNIDNLDNKLFIKDSKTYYISSVNPHYLGAAFIVIQKDTKPLNILNDLIATAIFVIIITLITSYFLVRAVLKPLRDNLRLLDNFIKETTHELNTPITTIMANIETLQSKDCDEKSMKKLQRIKSASATISNLYEDLVYILLNHQVSSQNKELNLSQILQERVSYFSFMANAKRLTLNVDIDEGVTFYADKKKIEKLIDNILSNAIKYTNKATTITIRLTPSYLLISDEGNGMSQKEIGMIFQRYKRFDKTQGGFGIGYSIIKSIVDEYYIDIDIKSELQKGTKVTLRW